MQTLALAFRLPEEAPRHPNWRPSPYSFETVLPLVFTTHILVPSKATPTGPLPTLNVPIFVPSLARSLVTVLSPWFPTQIFAPSKATQYGLMPILNVPMGGPPN